MSTQIFSQKERTLTDKSVVFDVVIQDLASQAIITIHAVDEAHADEIGRQLLKAGFNS